eukprot:scaffold63302_cov22-Cyclotella_meneghiniana.AAC.1
MKLINDIVLMLLVTAIRIGTVSAFASLIRFSRPSCTASRPDCVIGSFDGCVAAICGEKSTCEPSGCCEGYCAGCSDATANQKCQWFTNTGWQSFGCDDGCCERPTCDGRDQCTSNASCITAGFKACVDGCCAMTCSNDPENWCFSEGDCDWDDIYERTCQNGCCVIRDDDDDDDVGPGDDDDDDVGPGSKSTKVSKSAKSKGPTSKSTKAAKKV